MESQQPLRVSRVTLQDLRLAGMALLAVFSGAYAVKLGLSPVYLAAVGGAFILTLTSLIEGRGHSLPFWGGVCLTAGGLAWMLIFHCLVRASTLPNAVNLVMGPLIFGLLVTGAKDVRRDQYESLARWHVYISVLIMCLECIWRITHPDYSYLNQVTELDREDLAFYAYKLSSFMYQDSNFVGLQLVVLAGFLLGLAREGIKFNPLIHALVLALVVMTLSRASIFTVIFLYGLRFYFEAKLLGRVLCVIFGGLLVMATFVLYIQTDGSFASKFDVLDRMVEHLRQASGGEVLFGVGAGLAREAIGMGGHNILVTYLLELGVLGSLFFFVFWLLAVYATPFATLMLVGLLVNGFSLTSYAVPYFYASLAMLWLLRRVQA